MSIKILAVLTRTTNTRYLRNMLELIQAWGKAEVTCVTPSEYLAAPQQGYDLLVYNTFPDEKNTSKFRAHVTLRADDKYHDFKGMKILFDTHDNGTRDGFERFNDSTTLRIKVNPAKGFKYSLHVPYPVYRIFMRPAMMRDSHLVHVQFMGTMPWRKDIAEKIKIFNPETAWLPLREHAQRLCKTKINVVDKGIGDSCLSHVDTLAAGALLFTHEDIDKVRILPYAELIDGVNYVSFNKDNVGAKLEHLLWDEVRTNRIRLAGLKAFGEGYSVSRSTDHLLSLVGL